MIDKERMEAMEAMATVEANGIAWRSDMHTAVVDEAARTGKPPLLVAAAHALAVTLSPDLGAFPARLWGEYVAWLSGTLDAARAKRWARAVGERR